MTAGTITAHAVHSTSLETPPVRAVKAITTIQKYGRMIGTETTTRKASTADWAETLRRHARRASAGPIAARLGRGPCDCVVGRHQCTSIRGGCRSFFMSISRHSASAADHADHDQDE